MKQYFKSILPNGLTVISYVHPHVNSAVIGLWVNVGSRHETSVQEGFSHFTEHMLFKGTFARDPYQIVQNIEKLGGDINAYTSREHTCFITTVLGKDYKESLNVLLDIACNSKMDKEQFELERTVILNELASIEDDPEDLVNDRLYEKLFKDSSIAHSILGTEDSITSCTRNNLHDFYKTNYSFDNMVITCTGNIVHDDICTFLSEYKSVKNTNKKIINTATPKYCFEIIKKDYELVHCVIGVPGIAYNSPDRYKALILNNILGEGMSSRLFQNIREKYGMVYSIYSDLNFYSDLSLQTIHFATEKRNFGKMFKRVIEEIKNLKHGSIEAKELQESKNELTGAGMISMDDLDTEITVLARTHFYAGRYIPLKEAISHLNRVKLEEINQFANKTFTNRDFGVTIAGSISDKESKTIEVIADELND